MSDHLTSHSGKLPSPLVLFMLCIAVWIVPKAVLGDPELKAALLVSDEADAGEGAVAAIQSHLTDLPVELVIEKTGEVSFDLTQLHSIVFEVAARTQSKVVFFADFRSSARTVLYVSIPKVGTTLVRHIDCPEETIDSRYEAAAVIIRGILSAMLGGGEIGIHVPPAPPSRPPEEEAPPEETTTTTEKAELKPETRDADVAKGEETPIVEIDSKSSRFRFGFEAAYALSMLSKEALAVHGLRTAVLGFVTESIYLFIDYRLTVPFTAELPISIAVEPQGEIRSQGDIILTASPHPVSIGTGMELQWDSLSLRAGVAMLLDVMSWSPKPSADTNPSVLDTGSDGITLRAAVSPFAVLGWQFTETATLFFGLFFDIFYYREAFTLTIKDPQGEEEREVELMSLWVVNPCFQLGLRFSLF